MARVAGRSGRIYISTTSGGNAVPVAFLRSWSIDQSSDNIEVTAFGDTTKTYVKGLVDAQGQLAGFYDDAGSNTIYAAATAEAGSAKKFYLYPVVSDATKYWYGTAFFDVSTSAEVNGAVEFSASWVAATSVVAVGI